MFRKLSIENFQSHRDTSISFSSGVNVIIGKSDSGKSAIIRAIRWLVENKPNGNSFISYDGSKSKVTVELDTCKVTRTKDRQSANEYVIADADQKSTMKAFGQNVPDKVSSAFKFHDVNTQFQLDQPFILSMTPGEIAQYLNEVMNLGIIDSTMSNINLMARKCSSEMSATALLITSNSDELAKLEWVCDAVADCKKLEVLDEKYDTISSKIESAAEFARKYELSCNDLLAAKERSESISKVISDVDLLAAEQKKISSDVCDIADVMRKLAIAISSEHECELESDRIATEIGKFKICESCGRPL